MSHKDSISQQALAKKTASAQSKQSFTVSTKHGFSFGFFAGQSNIILLLLVSAAENKQRHTALEVLE